MQQRGAEVPSQKEASKGKSFRLWGARSPGRSNTGKSGEALLRALGFQAKTPKKSDAVSEAASNVPRADTVLGCLGQGPGSPSSCNLCAIPRRPSQKRESAGWEGRCLWWRGSVYLQPPSSVRQGSNPQSGHNPAALRAAPPGSSGAPRQGPK